MEHILSKEIQTSYFKKGKIIISKIGFTIDKVKMVKNFPIILCLNPMSKYIYLISIKKLLLVK